MRRGNIEFRYSSQKYELIKWEENGEGCYVIAFFDKGKEGYNMRTVGERFFEDHDAWLVGKHAIAFLEDVFFEEKNVELP